MNICKAKGWSLEIFYFKELASTQIHLMENIGEYRVPTLIYTRNQTDGIGSRNNEWQGVEGNLFFSFVLSEEMLPKDLSTSSVSVYFGYLIKDILTSLGSQSYLKWPNDFYLGEQKIGGLITNKKSDLFYIGVGINLVENAYKLHFLDINLDIKCFFNELKTKINDLISWKDIFHQYKTEFYKNDDHFVHIKGHKQNLRECELNEDGSITINSEKVYSLR